MSGKLEKLRLLDWSFNTMLVPLFFSEGFFLAIIYLFPGAPQGHPGPVLLLNSVLDPLHLFDTIVAISCSRATAATIIFNKC